MHKIFKKLIKIKVNLQKIKKNLFSLNSGRIYKTKVMISWIYKLMINS